MKDDNIQRFIFEHQSVRGEIVRLSHSILAMEKNQNYPAALAQLLGQSLAAACLMSTLLKFEGRVSLQFQGSAALNLLYAESDNQQRIKATARWTDPLPADKFKSLLDGGHLVVTLEPEKGQRYQGIIPLERDSLAACLEHYFLQSEQLPTGLWLFNDETAVYGLLLQQMPGEAEDKEFWNQLNILANTLKSDDFKKWNNQELLHRLFNEDDIRLFDEQDVAYHCGCSIERCERSLLTLSVAELESLVNEEGQFTEMTCEFCNATYQINLVNMLALLKSSSSGKH